MSKNAEDLLTEWVRNRTKGYTGIVITDFTTSFLNGLAFCALVHSYDKNLFDYKSLSPRNPEANLKLAFDKVNLVSDSFF
jgi:hypothetical protein